MPSLDLLADLLENAEIKHKFILSFVIGKDNKLKQLWQSSGYLQRL
jgi:hypothetical protein